jgi:TRAP-type C4-dicarboxylate transport system permease small subunit
MGLVNLLTDIAAVISGVLVCILVVMITISVLLRYYFQLSVGWSTELAEYFIYIVAVLGAPWVLRKDAHVVVDVVINLLPPGLKRWVGVAVNLLGAFIGFGLLYYSGLATYENFVKGTLVIRVMPIPRYLLLLFIPIMSVLVSLQFLHKSWQGLTSPPAVEEKEKEPESVISV